MSCIRDKVSLITQILLLISLLVSCASTPEVSENDLTEVSPQEDLTSEGDTDHTQVLTTLEELELKREEALAAKAHKAAHTEYSSAESYKTQGLDFYKNQLYQDAINSYQLAIEMYQESIKISINKRELALKALNKAEEAIQKTEENAVKAINEGEEEEL